MSQNQVENGVAVVEDEKQLNKAPYETGFFSINIVAYS